MIGDKHSGQTQNVRAISTISGTYRFLLCIRIVLFMFHHAKTFCCELKDIGLHLFLTLKLYFFLASEIGNAYAVLSNPEKRKQYDLTGNEEQTCNHPSNGRFNFHRGCEADITPEDLFNMFFGGAFPTGISIHQRNGDTVVLLSGIRHRQSGHEREEERGDVCFSMFIQLMPVIVLILVSLLSQLMVSNPPYALYPRSTRQTIKMQTENLGVVYYVNKDFRNEYKGASLQKVEKSVEEDYVSNIRNNCWKERQQKTELLHASKVYRDDRLRKKAESMSMENCKELERLTSLYRGG
uniref:DUF1977 domain-containing protein n=1 Tax=Pavo cristatus TaxID=9049 RepID=A0A8C9EQ78_PAVCR